jgi:DNA-binding IclR family transcriptional regulator
MKVIFKTFEILEFVINSSSTAVSPKMVSEKLEMNHSTCIRIMSVLRKKGYLKLISRRDGYIPGAALYAHYNSMRWPYGRLAHIAEKPIRKLARDLNTVVNISVMQDEAKYILYHFCGNGRKIETKTRYEDDHHCNATGMLLLSHSDNKIIRDYYDRFSAGIEFEWKGVNSLEAFELKLNMLKQKGEINYTSVHNSNMLIVGNIVDVSDTITAAIGFGYFEGNPEFAIERARQTAKEIRDAYNMEEQFIF